MTSGAFPYSEESSVDVTANIPFLGIFLNTESKYWTDDP